MGETTKEEIPSLSSFSSDTGSEKLDGSSDRSAWNKGLKVGFGIFLYAFWLGALFISGVAIALANRYQLDQGLLFIAGGAAVAIVLIATFLDYLGRGSSERQGHTFRVDQLLTGWADFCTGYNPLPNTRDLGSDHLSVGSTRTVGLGPRGRSERGSSPSLEENPAPPLLVSAPSFPSSTVPGTSEGSGDPEAAPPPSGPLEKASGDSNLPGNK